uniref:Envelope glycoprotein n=1 Tax=Haemonchus contortus TaxID=6289 RepID=A0A7I4YI75_HAECO
SSYSIPTSSGYTGITIYCIHSESEGNIVASGAGAISHTTDGLEIELDPIHFHLKTRPSIASRRVLELECVFRSRLRSLRYKRKRFNYSQN